MLPRQIAHAIEGGSGPSWFPALTAQLAASEWAALLFSSKITRNTYSSSRILTSNPATPRITPSIFTVANSASDSLPIFLELLPQQQAAQFKMCGLDFSEKAFYAVPHTLGVLRAAFNLIALSPTLNDTVLELVHSIHFLNTQDSQIDVSFSDPKIPFSIFVSVPPDGAANASLRLAEAIVHEAMHLQLTLIEKYVPLIGGEQTKFFSPWKNEHRKASGLLHALYVYTVIDEWLGLLPLDGDPYISSRIWQIREQVGTIRATGFERDLSAQGQLLSAYLLARFHAPF